MFKRHEPDWTSLISGVTFCVIAVAYLGGEITHRSLELRWIMPLLFIGLGLAGVAGTVVRARRLSVPPVGTPTAAGPVETATPTNSEDRSGDEPHPSSP
jgi:hypothetical protein